MRIRLLVDISGSFNGRAWPRRGQEIEVPDNIGKRMCALGQALPVASRPVETAVVGDELIETRTETHPGLKALGGGWYELGNGSRVRGLKNAQDAACEQ